MFENLRKAVRNMIQKSGAESGLSKQFKDIFELGGVPAFNQFYYFGIFPWKYVFRGYYKPWHLVKAPTIADPNHTRDLARLNMAKAVSAELAGLVWNEQCTVAVSQEGAEDQPLDEFVQEVLQKNNFWTKMQEHIEQSMALGGGALKVWVEHRRDQNGDPIPGSEELKIGYCMADQFVPTAWNNAEVTEGVFISREAKGGYYYTRLEWHKWDGETYWVTNELFRADQKNGSQEPQDILGFRYPLETIYPELSPETSLQGIENSLFAYYRTAIANNIDDNSPLGVSIYANAMDTLRALDICYDSLVNEFRLGRKRIIVPASMVRTVTDPQTGAVRRYFDATNEVYEALSTDDPDSLKIQEQNTTLRVDEHIDAINALLSVLCLQLGFSAGTFTFDRQSGIKTATEVISENSKTFKTVKSHQLQVKAAIERLVDSIIEVAALYDLQWNGLRIKDLAAKGWERKVTFDDSILQDRQTNINEGILLVGNGLMSKKTFLVEKLGYTNEEAEAELEAVRNEGAVSGGVLDRLFVGGAE